WTISGNSFYQTNPRATTEVNQGANDGFVSYGVYINNAGSNYVITNNFIGGRSANCGGLAWKTYADVLFGGSKDNRFCGIGLYAGSTAPSSIQGNTIQNFDWSGSTTTTGNSPTDPIYAGTWS